MCRLFVFAKADNDHPDPDQDHLKFKRGDVIDILPDGMHGGREAETSELFRIIEIPGLAVDNLVSLLMGDEPDDRSADHPRLRVNRLDLDALEASHTPQGRAPITTTRADVLARRGIVAKRPRVRSLGRR